LALIEHGKEIARQDIDSIHGLMSAFLTIENGITIIRQADQGFSLVTDPFGRTLAAMVRYTSNDLTMVA